MWLLSFPNPEVAGLILTQWAGHQIPFAPGGPTRISRPFTFKSLSGWSDLLEVYVPQNQAGKPLQCFTQN